MLCLPQWALAWSETDETVNLTAKRGEAIHNEWTEMIYETEPYIESGSVYVQIEKEDLGMISGFQSYKITEFQCYDEGTAVIKVSKFLRTRIAPYSVAKGLVMTDISEALKAS